MCTCTCRQQEKTEQRLRSLNREGPSQCFPFSSNNIILFNGTGECKDYIIKITNTVTDRLL